MLEPQSRWSPGAFAYVKNIVIYGITRPDKKHGNISVSPDNPGNLLMPMAVINATGDKRGLGPIDSLQLQLTELFKISKTIVGENESHFILGHFADYFEQLANSGNMEAFTRYITMSIYKDENTKWFEDNKDKLAAFNNWLTNTKRE